MDQEIDLRPYILALIRRWYWIIAAVAIAIVAAFLFSRPAAPVYQAQAIVAIVRSRTDISFDERIRTLPDTEVRPSSADRREALVTLATSSSLAATVLEEIGPQLPADLRSTDAVLGMIEIDGTGEVIFINARHTDPGTAALVANTWASHYEDYINNLFGVNRGDNDETIAAQISVAGQTYQAAQSDLEAFVGDNRIAALENEIASEQALLDEYQAARNAVTAAPVQLQTETQGQILSGYYHELQQIERWLSNAQSLREQVAASAGSPAARLGNTLALITLRSQVFGGAGDRTQTDEGTVIVDSAAPLALEISLGEDIEDVALSDVDALIQVLEARRETTQANIDQLSTELAMLSPTELTVTGDHPLNERIDEINGTILALEADLEAEQARQRELTQSRDLAWESYDALTRKQTEDVIAAQTTGSEVRVASSALPPLVPLGVGWTGAAVAGAAALLLSTFAILALEWWRTSSIMLEPQSLPHRQAASD